ncbi:putative amidoligase domain-containing protein [Longirhabdus pacifica]|uniref:putative amidoligase domain-containing protein n=1 Tax=Longirhabdus pacifica TaxID=2305227 RepID=UPI0013E8E12E|nr:hypothetical protein [Longirhabdus pacifica]
MQGNQRITLQWGKYMKKDTPFYVLNRKQSVDQLNNLQRVKHILALYNMHYEPYTHQSEWMKSYIVPVFNLNVLDVIEKFTRPTKTTFRYHALDASQLWYKRIAHAAIKCVYACGLDFALVELQMRGNGKCTIRHIDPAPHCDEAVASRFADAIHQFDMDVVKEYRRKERPMMGLDLEFLLVKGNEEVLPAHHILHKNGMIGTDSLYVNDHYEQVIAELRPNPAPEPNRLLKHVWQTMQKAHHMIEPEDVKWYGGGMPCDGYSLGGHIHLSNIWLHTHLLRTLDNYLALPLVLLEDSTTKHRRKKHGYLGNFRLKNHGGFEYRTLPSFIVSPLITKGVLALTYVITHHYRELTKQPLNDYHVLKAYFQGDKATLKPIVLDLWEQLEQCDSYQKYKAYLQPMKQSIIDNRHWVENKDIKTRWKLHPTSQRLIQV